MSETRRHTGILKRIDVNDTEKFFEEKVRQFAKEHPAFNLEQQLKDAISDYDCNFTNKKPWYAIYDSLDKGNYIIVNDILFEVHDNEEDPYDNYTIITKISDNEYKYFSEFYDGGTYLEECLTDEIAKMKLQKC